MIFRSLDNNGDWRFGKGVSNYATRVDAIGLNIKTRIMSWLGDCFFAQTEGIDWSNRLGSKNQRELLEQDIRRTIQQSTGVTGLLSFSSDYNERARTIQLSYSVSTIYSRNYQGNLTVNA